MFNKIVKRMAAGLLCAAMVACYDYDDIGPLAGGADLALVDFSTDVTTRANTLIDDTAALKKTTGIGVFAYFTDEKPWAEATAKATTAEYFMYNQRVTWGVQRVDTLDDKPEPAYGWIYSPPKYWPNSSGNAAPRYISFFAYAPYVAEPESGAGVIGMPGNENWLPHLKYKTGTVGNMVDLLYAEPVFDATRNGHGLIEVKDGKNQYQKVLLEFHHALACVEVYIQRGYEEPHFSGNVLKDKGTKLFVSQLELASKSDIYDEGVLDLAYSTPEETTSGDDASGNGAGSDSPEKGLWSDLKSSLDKKLTYTEELFNDSISGTTKTDLPVIVDRELNKWGLADYGVDEKERCLFKNGDALFFLPQTLELTPTLTYTMVTRDNELVLSDYTDKSGNKYARIAHNVTGNTLKLNVQQGKRYKLLIHVDVEHVSCEVVSVTDWDFPLRFDPSVVSDFNEENKNHTLDEHNHEQNEENKAD